MELVYLWVEEYKNIKNQGFNFSPRFKCEFDGENLTIKETGNDVSIFPENINITAIVGENGSGKSAILKKILDLGISGSTYKMCMYDKKLNVIYSNIKINNDSNLKSKTKIFNFGFPDEIIQNSFLYHYKNDIDLPVLYNRYGIYNENEKIFTEPNKGKSILNIFEKEDNIQKKLISLVKDKFYEKIDENSFFVPKHITIKYNQNLDFECTKKYNHQFRNNLKIKLTPKELLLLDLFIYLQSIFSISGHGYELQDIKIFNEEGLSSQSLKKDIEVYYNDLLNDKYLEQIKEQEKKAINVNIYKENIEILFEARKSLNLLKNIDGFLSLLTKTYDFSSISIHKLREDNENIEIIKELPKFLELNFYSSGSTNYNNLSTGEKSLLEIVYSIKEIINLREKNKLSKNLFVLLDEIENNLNPNWQKKLLNILIDISSVYSVDIHFIITTHSPFILSDLPKENVIFLDKVDEDTKEKYPFLNISNLEKGNCIDVSKYIDINPFGANIHTLLSHGFFMKDGLMGEFAKEKIQSIIKCHNKLLRGKLDKKEKTQLKNKYEKDKKEQFKQIQKIIGDDYLKQVIKNHIIEIEKILYDDFMLDEEIKHLETKLNKLKELKNNA